MTPIAYINVEKRTLEFAKNIFWHTPTVANLDRIPLFTKEVLAQEQEPVAWKLPDKNVVFWEDTKEVDEYHGFKPTIPLYTHPQRTWVDLTRTQMQDVYFAVLEEHRGGHQMEGQLAFGEALQAKIKERNT